MPYQKDILWQHFQPIWRAFNIIDDRILVAGGYGLFLKENWLRDNQSQKTVIPIKDWIESPRVTQDIDLILELEIIGDKLKQERLTKALKEHAFEETEKEHGKRWQFIKKLAEEKKLAVEFHVQPPNEDEQNITTTNLSVKHKPSLGKKGIHGRKNREAIGSHLYPQEFMVENTNIRIPNTLTWTVMKLTAAKDNWEKCQPNTKDVNTGNGFNLSQARKHAGDVFRSVAMMSEAERSAADLVFDEIRESNELQIAKQAVQDLFEKDETWANVVISKNWDQKDFNTIHDQIRSLYRLPSL